MQSPNRGQILLMKKDSVGKERPILLVSPHFLNGGYFVRGVPFTSQQIDKRKAWETCVFFQRGEFGLELDCVAMTSELAEFRISEFQPGKVIGVVDDIRMLEVSKALCCSLGIDFHKVAAAYPLPRPENSR